MGMLHWSQDCANPSVEVGVEGDTGATGCLRVEHAVHFQGVLMPLAWSSVVGNPVLSLPPCS